MASQHATQSTLGTFLGKLAAHVRVALACSRRSKINLKEPSSNVVGVCDENLEWQQMIFVEERTFLSWKPRLLDANSVVQSTTEAVNSELEAYLGSFGGVNPRRYA